MSRYTYDKTSKELDIIAGVPAMDTEPVEDSIKPITSGGVYDVVDEFTQINNNLGAKNLLPNKATTQTINGVTFTVNPDGSVTTDGTTTADTSFYLSTISYPKGDYVLNGCPENGSVSTYRIGITAVGSDKGSGFAFSLSQDTTLEIRIIIMSGTTVSNLTFYPMLRPAYITDDTYEPYARSNQELTGEVEPMLNVLGAKNLLPTNNATTQVKEGVTFTKNSDGSITVTGSNTTQSYLNLYLFTVEGGYANGTKNLIPAGNYILSGAEKCPSSAVSLDLLVYKDLSDYIRMTQVAGQSPVPFTIPNGYDTFVGILMVPPSTLNINATFYPMIRPASIKDDTYVPYAMTNRELTLKGVDVDILTITATTQTGSGTGAALIPKASYPQYKIIIPFGVTLDLLYTVELYNSNEINWLIGVRQATTGAWMSGTTVTFKAFGIK